ILLMAVVQLIFGGFGGRSVLHDWGCVRGGVLGYRSLGPSGEKLPQASAETLLELPEPGLGRAGVRSGVRDRPVAERDLRQRARGVHGQCDHCAIMRGENQPPVREEQGGVRVTVVAQGIGASPDIAPGGAGAHVGGEVLQLIAEGAHPAERETACELCREVLRHVDALQLFPQCVVEGGVPVFTRSVIGGLGTGAVPRDAVGHRETGTLGRVGAIVSWGNSLVNSTVNGAVSGGAGGRESEKRPRPIALELGAGIQKNGIRSLSALVAA